MLKPTKQTAPAMPPTTTATTCLCAGLMKGSQTQCGVSKP